MAWLAGLFKKNRTSDISKTAENYGSPEVAGMTNEAKAKAAKAKQDKETKDKADAEAAKAKREKESTMSAGAYASIANTLLSGKVDPNDVEKKKAQKKK